MILLKICNVNEFVHEEYAYACRDCLFTSEIKGVHDYMSSIFELLRLFEGMRFWFHLRLVNSTLVRLMLAGLCLVCLVCHNL